MPDDSLTDPIASDQSAAATGDGKMVETVLTTEIREHLGRHLRSAYRETEAKPAFLGDTTMPPQFETLVRRLDRTERIHQAAIDAVGSALGVKATGER